MRRITFVAASAVLALCSLGSLGIAQSPKPTIYISPDGGFQTALTAALFKKHVPATVITDESKAKYILKAAPVDSKARAVQERLLAACSQTASESMEIPRFQCNSCSVTAVQSCGLIR
ncbi:MAG: hypothetical protein ACLGRW_11015 [Acidobacteriota bacterium]